MKEDVLKGKKTSSAKEKSDVKKTGGAAQKSDVKKAGESAAKKADAKKSGGGSVKAGGGAAEVVKAPRAAELVMSAFRVSPEYIVILDTELKIVDCSNDFLRLMNYNTVAKVKGKSFFKEDRLYGGKFTEQHAKEILFDLMKTGDTFSDSGRFSMDYSKQNFRDYMYHAIPLYDKGGECAGLFLKFNDVTELLAAQRKAEAANLAKSNFLSNMSHEMRTPLNAVIGMTNIAKASKDSERVSYCLEKIGDSAKQLLEIIEDILDMSKIASNEFSLTYSDFNIEKMVQNAAATIEKQVGEKDQEFLISLDNNLPLRVISDEHRLTQVLTILLSNATKFTRQGGTISLDVKMLLSDEDSCTLQFVVKDNGIGMSEEQKRRLFTVFTQEDEGKSRKHGGMGLGLAIAKSVVELLGGGISVESQQGKGSKFVFSVRVQTDKSYGKNVTARNVNWKNLRVLAVDDAEDIRKYFQRLATSMNFACDVANGGAEAVGLLEKSVDTNMPYDIIFVDWRMPFMSGTELAYHIKNGFDSNTVIMMIPPAEMPEYEAEANKSGVDGFIAKPLFSSKIADCINKYLGAPQVIDEVKDGAVSFEGCFKGYRILLAEDVEINCEIVYAVLEETGIEIDFAENGRDAYEMFETDHDDYDLIFMDIHMPEMDGYESTKLIRALDIPKAKTVPIIAMTANVFPEDVARCLESGMNDHVGKPLDFDEVIGKLAKHLPSRPKRKWKR